jgi:hypothetical protein
MNGLQWIDWDSKSNYLFQFTILQAWEPNAPSNKLNSFKLAAQYSFYVWKTQDEYGFGYIHELNLLNWQIRKREFFYRKMFTTLCRR